MNIAIYSRKSVYSDKSDSIESQLNMCKDYISLNYKDVVVTEYEDEGFTGANTKRPAFTQLMRDIENKNIDVLVCYKIDRISRNVLDFSKTFNILQEHNVQFVSIKEQIDTSTPLGRAMMYICSVFAQMERETIAERVKDSMLELAKSGKWAGGPAPLGYSLQKVVISGKTHTTLVPDKEREPYLDMIFDKFLNGYTLSGLATYFRKSGIKTARNSLLTRARIYEILKNPHYAEATKEMYDYFEELGCTIACAKEDFDGKHGIIVYGRTKGSKCKKQTADNWIITAGLHEPIVPAQKWLKAQEVFGKNIFNKTKKYEIGLLRGIIRCKKCNCLLAAKRKVTHKSGKIYDGYCCQHRNEHGREYCDLKMISVKSMDNKLIEFLKQLSINKDLIAKYMKESEKTQNYRSKSVITKEISDTNKKIENLTLALQDNNNSTAAKYIITEIENLDKKITGLNYELRESEYKEIEASKQKNDVDDVYNKICYLLNNFENLSYEKKTGVLKEIIKECSWDGETLKIVL